MKRAALAILLTLLVTITFGSMLNLNYVQPARAQLFADAYTLALWHFNEGAGQYVYDESSHQNDGTLGPTSNVESKDPSWVLGHTGQPGDYAISLDDWYDYVNIPDNPDESLDLLGGDQFTIEFWTYVRQVSRANRGNGHQWNHFLSKYPFGTPYSAYFLYQSSYYPFCRFGFYDSTSAYCTTGCLPPPTHQWVHVMIAYDGQYLRIYYDEVLQVESDIGHHYVLGNDHSLAIGDNQNNDNPWTDGVDCIIDEVRISSIARAPPIEGTIDIDPDALNLKSNGQFVTAYVELPEGYSVADIVLESLYLEEVQAVTDPNYDFVTDPSSYLVDHDGDGILERMAKFSRLDLVSHLRAIDLDAEELEYLHGCTEVTLTLTGSLADGTKFEGEDIITILEKGKQ